MSRFSAYLPVPLLRPYVRQLVITESEQAQTYKVLPGTCLVLGFQYSGQLATFEGGSPRALSAIGITGLQDAYRVFGNETHTGSILVYFTETGAAAFFKVPMHELFAQSLSLDYFVGRSQLAVVEEKLSQAGSDRQKVAVVEQFLLSQLKNPPDDPLVNAAVEHIYRSKGTMPISGLARQLNISQSPLEKRFRKMVGASPKKFAGIVRFQALLQLAPGAPSYTDLAYQLGYYDQSHFIRDFKVFTGESPEKFFALRAKNDFLQS